MFSGLFSTPDAAVSGISRRGWCYKIGNLEETSVGTEFVGATGTGLPRHAVLVLDFTGRERGTIRREKPVEAAEVGGGGGGGDGGGIEEHDGLSRRSWGRRHGRRGR